MHEHEKYYNAVISWTPVLDDLAKAQIAINIALRALSEKRVTLEEKMIRMHLHQLSASASSVIQEAHQLLPSHCESIPNNLLDELKALTSEIEKVVADLNKIIAYNLNFLEQYYEYDYNSRLQNEHRFVERMQTISFALQSAKTNALNHSK